MKILKICSCVLVFVTHLAYGEVDVMGVKVFSTLEELVDPDRAVVCVIDMQNEYISTQGGLGRDNKEAEPDPEKHQIRSENAEQVTALQSLLKAAREAGVTVVYMERIHEDVRGEKLVTGAELYQHVGAEYVSHIKAGSWASKTIAEIAPQEGDMIFQHARDNALHGLPFDHILRSLEKECLILAGREASAAIFRTSVGCYCRGIYPICVRDAIEPDEVWFKRLEVSFPVYNVDEVIGVWEGK